MSQFNTYLNHIHLHYDDFRYLSDKNSLEIIDTLDRIAYEWIENEGGFACVFIDTNIPGGICFFGYLEVIGDFNKIFTQIKDFARRNNCTKILGPINISAWNTYRFSDTVCNNTIHGEYQNNFAAHNTLLQHGFHIYEEYLTVYRDGTNPFTHYTPDIDITLQIEAGPIGLPLVYALSREIFQTIPPIEYNEFLIYMNAYIELYGDTSTIFILRYQGVPIGFLSSLSTAEYFVIKTLGVLPEYRKKGYGNMLLDSAFRYFFEKNIFQSYGLYMRKTGEVMNMSNGGGELYRKYFTYIYQL